MWRGIEVACAGIAVALLALLLIAGRTPPKDTPAYCIDPFASRDMGWAVYTPCSHVPMWSIKV